MESWKWGGPGLDGWKCSELFAKAECSERNGQQFNP